MTPCFRWPTAACIALFAHPMVWQSFAAADETNRREPILSLSIQPQKKLTFLDSGIVDTMTAGVGQPAGVIRRTASGNGPFRCGRIIFSQPADRVPEPYRFALPDLEETHAGYPIQPGQLYPHDRKRG